ncbi:chemotaxis protein [Pseudomonas taeanensis MS-3]|uniref:Chemotaxis protein n=2 Tax=Pseudomonas taeanensis TaxID=574962 RepID=A0A0A1YGD8_9PSED|nr:methyl-accepting chemotaxis protein [Pseudomonas taeanensis]KFX68987.1 chemotaxis protein [Pseudomonas taeanensis MS-3]
MWKVLQRRVASLSTAKKLAWGFGVVLALTAVVAATGFSALRDVGQRSALLERMSSINSQVLQIRRSEQDFALTGDMKHAKLLHEQAQAILERSTALQAEMPADERPLLDEVAAAVAEYQAAFDRYVEQTDSMSLSLDAANWLVVSSSNSLDLLKDGLSEDGVDLLKSSLGEEGAESVAQAGQISTIHQLLLEALDQARVLLEQSRRSSEAAQTEIKQARDAQKLASELRDAMSDPGYSSVLGDVIIGIDSFNERLAEYTRHLQQQKQEHAQLVVQAERIVALVGEGYAKQRAGMEAQLQTSTWLILLAAALALVIGLLATLTITLLIVRPLKQVIQHARNIADGDLSVDIEVQRTDEVGQLLAAMQAMSLSLREMVGRLQGGVTQISASAQSLSAVTEQTRQGVNGQKAETDQVATAMSEMTATVHDVARNAEAAAGSAAEADKRVISGTEVVRQTLARINQLAAAMATTTQSIEQLSEDAQRIDSVLDVIKSVAEQTNLLALNAAIEAARAGEQGRGFAVVADEVRALAKRTQQSTEEIEGLIATLREGVRRSVEDMSKSGTLVEQTVQDANQTEGALTGIAGSVTQIFEMNQQIAAAAEQQSAVAEEISRSVTLIRDIADQSSTAMDESAGSSIRLAELGVELQGMAGHFRL